MDHLGLATRSDELRATRTPFVHARVVLAQRPASATPGDEALVLPDGTIEGFVGGTCAESTVREQSLQAMASGQPRIVRITPTPQPDEHPGKVVVHNTCLSGGTLEVFLEPDLPPPLLVVVGDSPIAAAVTAVGEAVGWQVRRWVGIIPEDADALVVATHGRDEHEAWPARWQPTWPMSDWWPVPRVAMRSWPRSMSAIKLGVGSTRPPGWTSGRTRPRRSPCQSWPASSRPETPPGPDTRTSRQPGMPVTMGSPGPTDLTRNRPAVRVDPLTRQRAIALPGHRSHRTAPVTRCVAWPSR